MKGDDQPKDQASTRLRRLVARGFSLFEDAVYIALGILLAYCAIALLVTAGVSVWKSTLAGAPLQGIVDLLDRMLIVLMIVELLYTVQVSFRAHTLAPEPFLIVGLIAVTRRILVVTAQVSTWAEQGTGRFRDAMLELVVLVLMVVALCASLLMLRKRSTAAGVSSEVP